MTRARLLCPHARDGGAGAGEGKINKNIQPNKTFFYEKVILGEMASLHCIYDMEGEELYSVKWYKVSRP